METGKYILNYLIPQRCILCSNIINVIKLHYPICYECSNNLLQLDNNCCNICGFPLISESTRCLRCRDSKFNYISNVSLYVYSGNVKEVIYQYKFQHKKSISLFFAAKIADIIIKKYPEYIIVPVPGRKIVKKKIGWEHIDLISNILKQKYKLPVQKILTRKGSKAQKTLSREKRAENLRKNIKLRKRIKKLPEQVVLLDDVFTTGTTINECAGILKDAGVSKIYSLTIAID